MKIFLSHKSRSSAIINHFSESAIGTFQFLLANGCFHEWDRLNSLLGANPKWINLRDTVRCTPETAADKTIDHDPDYFVSPKAARSQEKKMTFQYSAVSRRNLMKSVAAAGLLANFSLTPLSQAVAAAMEEMETVRCFSFVVNCFFFRP